MTVVSFDDLAFLVRRDSIIRLDLNTGNLTTKRTGSRLISFASTTPYLQCVTVGFVEGNVGLFNTRLELIQTISIPLATIKVLAVDSYLVLCSK